MNKKKKRKKPSYLEDYSTDVMGRYHVEVYDLKNVKIDETYVNAFTRRDAYYEAMDKLKHHYLWDASRIKNI
jgi:hypothetical protein